MNAGKSSGGASSGRSASSKSSSASSSAKGKSASSSSVADKSAASKPAAQARSISDGVSLSKETKDKEKSSGVNLGAWDDVDSDSKPAKTSDQARAEAQSEKAVKTSDQARDEARAGEAAKKDTVDAGPGRKDLAEWHA